MTPAANARNPVARRCLKPKFRMGQTERGAAGGREGLQGSDCKAQIAPLRGAELRLIQASREAIGSAMGGDDADLPSGAAGWCQIHIHMYTHTPIRDIREVSEKECQEGREGGQEGVTSI